MEPSLATNGLQRNTLDTCVVSLFFESKKPEITRFVRFPAPTECLSDESKLELTETCFDPHEKLKSLVTSCFGSTRKCSSATNEEKVMNCIIVASTQVVEATVYLIQY